MFIFFRTCPFCHFLPVFYCAPLGSATATAAAAAKECFVVCCTCFCFFFFLMLLDCVVRLSLFWPALNQAFADSCSDDRQHLARMLNFSSLSHCHWQHFCVCIVRFFLTFLFLHYSVYTRSKFCSLSCILFFLVSIFNFFRTKGCLAARLSSNVRFCRFFLSYHCFTIVVFHCLVWFQSFWS